MRINQAPSWSQSAVRVLLVFVIAGVAPEELLAQCHYTVTEIPASGSPSPVAINNRGHVIGNYFLGEAWRGFFWSPESGLIMLPRPAGMEDVSVSDLNDLDHVVGYMNSPTQGWFAFVWDGQGYTLIPPPAWANMIWASAINDRGEVVGATNNASTGPLTPFFWSNGNYVDLRPFFGSAHAEALDISEQSEILGNAVVSVSPVRRQPFILRNGTLEWVAIPEAFNSAEAWSLNDNEIRVGVGYVGDFGDPDFRASGVIWDDECEHIVSPPPHVRIASSDAVNNAGRVIGRFASSTSPGNFVWQFGSLYDLPSMLVPPPSYPFMHAPSINRLGQIVAYQAGLKIYSPVWMAGDVTGDCAVSIEDLVLVLSNFGLQLDAYPQGDANLDEIVDLADLAIVLANLGQ